MNVHTSELQAVNAQLRQEIEAHERTDAALRESEQRFRATFDNAAIGMAHVAPDGRWLMVNDRLCDIVGYPRAELLTRTFADITHPDDVDKDWAEARRLLAGEIDTYSMEKRYLRRDGGAVWIMLTVALVRRPDGAPRYFISTVDDITGRKHTEAALAVRHQQKDQFLAMLGHELRNPLAPIRTASELLTRAVGSQPEAKVALAILNRQTRQLARLVDDLLDVSRIAQGLINLKEDDAVEIGAVVEQAVETIRPLVQEKSHRLSIRKPFASLCVRGDSARLVQAIGNVLHNAAKYTEHGGQIDIEASRIDSEVVIVVRDTGCGIASELLPHVFDLFVQSPRTLDRSQGGLGVGLTVVRQLVQMHRGTVAAESAGLGCGSTFTIRLPHVESRRSHIPQTERYVPLPQRILVVDDNVDAAESLAMLLRLDGHDVSTVFNGAEVLRAAEELKPEIIFLDIGLPGMDGYEIARRLRLSNLPCPSLVALTGYGQTADREQALSAGFTAHLTKPVDLHILREVCWRVCVNTRADFTESKRA